MEDTDRDQSWLETQEVGRVQGDVAPRELGHLEQEQVKENQEGDTAPGL